MTSRKHIEDNRLIELLLIHGSVKATSAVIGISENAIYRRLQKPTLRQKYNEMQGMLLSLTATQMSEALGSAVATLKQIIENPESSDGVRVSASDALLRHCARYVELSSIITRIEALEESQKEKEV